MCKILLSINPEHVENIFNGNKKYEYRKIKCKEKVDKIIIYSTAPIMQVVGEAEVKKILEDTPEEIWKITQNESGINLEFFKKYYKGRKKAIAYQLTSIIKYEHPKTLKDYGLKMAPQSFIYVK
jgi:predicted transcriptional regulator